MPDDRLTWDGIDGFDIGNIFSKDNSKSTIHVLASNLWIALATYASKWKSI